MANQPRQSTTVAPPTPAEAVVDEPSDPAAAQASEEVETAPVQRLYDEAKRMLEEAQALATQIQEATSALAELDSSHVEHLIVEPGQKLVFIFPANSPMGTVQEIAERAVERFGEPNTLFLVGGIEVKVIDDGGA